MIIIREIGVNVKKPQFPNNLSISSLARRVLNVKSRILAFLKYYYVNCFYGEYIRR